VPGIKPRYLSLSNAVRYRHRKSQLTGHIDGGIPVVGRRSDYGNFKFS
jgi:hypothetical protein